ncbi:MULTISPECIES: nuclear transport factor 2 family protein [Sphingobium]|uniref:nuclear transport factor 2 family protein n=1 Tax=Sphingobium TaxID=165695 RepID=UPI00159C8C07|nr:nuclear transport factor 2 family protein [Sphingobium sp. 15-1]
MQTQDPQAVVEEFFRRVGTAEDVAEIAEMISDDVDWLVAGDTSVVPWIGHRTSKAAVAECYALLRAQTASEHFELTDMLVKGNRVVVLGALATRVLRTGKLIETEIAANIIVEHGRIKSFHLLEDSFNVAWACT